jgi:hypothetical protein
VHRAVHRLHVVRAVVHLHRRVHAVGVPLEVPGGLEELRVGQVRRVHELVAAVLVTRAAVVLHQLADDGALRVPHGEPAAQLAREAQQVEFVREFAVVALERLLELVEVIGERLLRLPRRAVDALQHRALLVAAPVGARHPLQLEEAELARRGHVRADAHVHERLRVAVGADDAALAHLCGVLAVGFRGLDALDDLDLVRLVGEELLRLRHRHLRTNERLVRLHDRTHLGLDAGEVVVAERGATGQFEVVVEAVLDGRADRELGAGEQPGDGLGHHVRRGVSEHVASLVGPRRDDRHRCAVVQRCGEVGLGAVDDRGDRRLLQAGADGGGQIERGGILGQLAFGSVGEGDRDVRHGTARIRAVARVRRVGSLDGRGQLPATRLSSCSTASDRCR